MTGFLALLKRELFALFVTPLAWVLIVVFLVIQGLHFFLLVEHFALSPEIGGDESPVTAFFGNTVILYLVLFLLIPPLTMRLFAEERRAGTIEGLLTAPISASAIVLAKYASALIAYVAMWLPTVLYIVIFARAGAVDVHAVCASYLGVLLVGAGYLAVGLLASAATNSQFIALVVTALAMLLLFILGIGEFVTKPEGVAHAFCSYVSVWSHMNEFANGIVDSRRIVFYLTLTALPLYVTVRVVSAMRLRA